MVEIFSMLRKDLYELEQLKDKIRNIPSNEFECADVLDLLDPIIRKKEKLYAEEHGRLRRLFGGKTNGWI